MQFDANIIFGSAFNADLEGAIRVSVVATGIDMHLMQQGGGHGGHSVSSGTHSGNQTASSQPQPQEAASSQKAAPVDQAPAPAARVETQQTQTAAPAIPAAPLNKTAERIAPPPLPVFKSSIEDDDSVFLAPRPVEPKLQQPVSSQPRHSYEQVQVSNKPTPQHTQQLEDKHHEKETPRTGLGLFGRMANSILGSSHDQEEDAHQTTRAEEERPTETPLAKEDTLDIPAFLRRKITH